MEEPGRLQSMGSPRVRHDSATSLSLFTFMPWRRKWQPTPVFLPGESQGRGSLVGCCLWGRTESDTTEVTQHSIAQQSISLLRFLICSLIMTFSPSQYLGLFIIVYSKKKKLCSNMWITSGLFQLAYFFLECWSDFPFAFLYLLVFDWTQAIIDNVLQRFWPLLSSLLIFFTLFHQLNYWLMTLNLWRLGQRET